MASAAPPRKKPKPSVPIDDLSLSPNLIQRLKEAHLTSFKAILHLSEPELQKATKVSASEAKNILKITSQAVLEKYPTSDNLINAVSLLNGNNSATRENFLIDILASGHICDGIFTRTITEICGESGSGKTQLCLHLSIHAQKPCSEGGMNCQVIYIYTEGNFPIKRFRQMAEAFKREHPSFKDFSLTDSLLLRKAQNLIETMHILQKEVPEVLLKVKNPKLIIIDSVAALLRCEYESQNSRTQMIQQLAYAIWKLANLYGLAVICVNQVSGFSDKNKVTGSRISDVPSLGLLWSNILTTRLKVSRNATQNPTIRTLDLIYSAYHPCIVTNFKVCETGIKIL